VNIRAVLDLQASDIHSQVRLGGLQKTPCIALFQRSVYLVFEYIGGGDLARVLDTMDAPFQLSHAKALVRQLLKACEFLHNRWIVHRDLKLSNLLVDDKYACFFICYQLVWPYVPACN